MTLYHSKHVILEVTIGFSSPFFVFSRLFSLNGGGGAEPFAIKGKNISQYFRSKPDVRVTSTIYLKNEEEMRRLTSAYRDGLPVIFRFIGKDIEDIQSDNSIHLGTFSGLITDIEMLATAGEFMVYDVTLGVSKMDITEEGENILKESPSPFD